MVLRQHKPTLATVSLPGMVDRKLLHGHASPTPLATPPAGSGLKPVLGDFGLPFIGHTLAHMRHPVDFALARYRRLGPVSWGGMLGRRVAAAAGPDATQVVLVNKDRVYSQQGWATLIDRFFHRGLMLLDFDEHLRHRRIMNHAFTRERLAGYAEQFGPVVDRGVTALPTDRPVRLYWKLKQLTLDVAARVFMDTPSGASKEINKAFVDAVRATTSFVRAPIPGGRWWAGVRGRELLERYFAERLPAKRASDSSDLFAALCHAEDADGARFTDTDVVNHMIFLMMAAHDTATITTTATVYYLGKHPDWQERVREEARTVGPGPLGLAELDALSTLELVIKESLRLAAPVPSLMRKTVRDTDLMGHYVPAGTLVVLSPTLNHYLSEYWTDPHAFDPMRFAEPRREDRSHRFAWVPFGGGAHKCIGMHFGMYEVKALLHAMLMRYRWWLPESYQLRWDHTALPVPADGLPVRLYRR